MEITFGSVLSEVAPYVGKTGSCPDSEKTRRFALRVIEHLIHKGGAGTLRKWCFFTPDACFVAPHDLEVPVRAKVDDLPEPVFSKWYDFFESSVASDYDGRYTTIREDALPAYTTHPLPHGGAFISAASLQPEPGATVIIQGLGNDGQPIFTEHKGQTIAGELLEVGTNDNPTHTRRIFTKITGTLWTKTKNRKRLFWYVDRPTKQVGLLSEARPNDTSPIYRKFWVSGCSGSCHRKITILGRVRALSDYHENDLVPITSMNAIVETAQFFFSKTNENIAMAQFRGQEVERITNDESEYKKFGQEPIEFVHLMSPGSLRKVI